LPRAFFVNMKGRNWSADAFAGLGRSFQLGEPLAQSGPQFVRTLVLGNGAYIFFESGAFLRHRLGGAISLFGIKCLWRKVCWHGYLTTSAFF